MDPSPDPVHRARRELLRALFPRGVPALWCPPLTHFRQDGSLDRERARAHLRFLAPWVRGFLVPGSTGEGWELSAAEAREVVAFAEGEIRALGGHLLVGALRPTAGETAEVVREGLAWLRGRASTPPGGAVPGGSSAGLEGTAVCGFRVCGAAGVERTQEELAAGLDEVLALGAPTAVYQLPQVTRNELAPETAAALAARHPNFVLWKDSSGGDRVARAGLRGPFLLRGAEGAYAEHLAAPGSDGAYDGFLLSTANAFPGELAALVEDARAGRRERAAARSAALSAIADELLRLGGEVGHGNAFTNANKALDHWSAHGPRAVGVPPPLLHSGRRLPAALVAAAGEALRRHGLLPARGYLDA